MKNTNIFTPAFYLLCLSSFFFFMSFNMILPELMIYIKEIGGEKYTGYVLATFTFTAFISRPFSGKLADTIGRIPIMVFGALVGTISAILYIFIDDIAKITGGTVSVIFVFLAIRLFHGMSTGFKPTGTTAFLADIISPKKRGEALGWLGFSGSIGMAAGPSLGAWLHLSYGYTTMFLVSAIVSLLSVAVIFNMKESLPQKDKKPFSIHQLYVKWDEFYEKQVILPTVSFFFYATAFGTIYTLIPLRTEDLNIPEFRGLFFTIYVGFTTIMRVIAGRISDRKGREPVLLGGLLLVIIALTVLGFATTKTTLIFGAIFFGLAHGVVGPTLSAWTTDLSFPEKRGRAFSTMFMGMELGIGGGALLASWLYKIYPTYFYTPFLVVVGLNCIALSLVAYSFIKKLKNV